MSEHTILCHRRRGVSLVATIVTLPPMPAAVQDLGGLDPTASTATAQATVLSCIQKNPVYESAPVRVDLLVEDVS